MISVSVRKLCDFTARTGDLDHRFTPSPSSLEGIEAHQKVTSTRPDTYQAEYPINGDCMGLTLNGRADGYDKAKGIIEEIKSHRGDLKHINPGQHGLHRAQLRTYGALIGKAEGLEAVNLKLTYWNVDNKEETSFEETASVTLLWQELENRCQHYAHWAKQESEHRKTRNQALEKLIFPFQDFRKGQRALSEAVYKTVINERMALVQAPTGIGKTVGTLYPALVALPRQSADRLFFLTVRNTGRMLALDALRLIFKPEHTASRIRVLVHSAKEQSCEYPSQACNGEACPLAKGFYDRLPAARAQALTSDDFLTPESVRLIALAHRICPYYLSQELARWCDLVIADVNYYFDQQALLHALTVQEKWRSVILVDEAHNLVNRARDMYSIRLSQFNVKRVQKSAPEKLKKPIASVSRAWRNLLKKHEELSAQTRPVLLDTLPQPLLRALTRLTSSIINYLAEKPGTPQLQDLLFESLRFINLAEVFDEHSICLLTINHSGSASLELRNLIPADFLAPRFTSASSALLFSATLSPRLYHQDLLGMADNTLWTNIESPFTAQQVVVNLVTNISTRFRDRENSIAPVVKRIAMQYREHPANYLVYVSSFDYLARLRQGFMSLAPDLPLHIQSPLMTTEERQHFVNEFKKDGRIIGLAVLGGAFAEGIDLPGSRLMGVYVLTLGLPPHDSSHDILKERLDRRFGQGYNYTYLYPGIQKVIQAAGRVIRSPEDTGIIELIDDRFTRPEILSLLPEWWPITLIDQKESGNPY